MSLSRSTLVAGTGAVVLAALSLALVPPALSYDPWSWLLWGEQLVDGDLSTTDGPAFKPLPVAVCALLSLAGPAAAWLWALAARAAAAVALWLAFQWGRRLAGGSVAAGVLAAIGVALCGSYLEYAASGLAEGVLLALVLGGAEAARAGRHRVALACALAAALLRVETWPFLVVAAVRMWRRRPEHRPLLLVATLLVPAAWFLPELAGSGDLLRSAARAQVPNPGQPALADVPVVASLRAAAALPPWPLWVGVGLALWMARPGTGRTATILAPAAAGMAWIALVAVMAQAGFSGEPRYALPGAALVALSGAVGLAPVLRRASLAGPAIGAATAVAAAVAVVTTAAGGAGPGPADLARLRHDQAYQWRLQSDLADAVAEVGGASAVLACGQPYVGPWRGPLMAHHLGVARHVVEPDRPPRPPGVVFRSALTAGTTPEPAVPPSFREVVRSGEWQVFARC